MRFIFAFLLVYACAYINAKEDAERQMKEYTREYKSWMGNRTQSQ